MILIFLGFAILIFGLYLCTTIFEASLGANSFIYGFLMLFLFAVSTIVPYTGGAMIVYYFINGEIK